MSPLAALVDQPVTATVQGVPTGAQTTLTATAKDGDGITRSAIASAGEVTELSLGSTAR